MATPTPYRSLPAARRVALLTSVMTAHRDTRFLYIQRLVAKGGGFRAVTLQTWSPERIAKEVVRLNAESSQDEMELLQMLYVDLEPETQIAFLDAAGVKHEAGKIGDDAELPYADAEHVVNAAEALRVAHGDTGMHYLRTIARYNSAAWPGLDEWLANADKQGLEQDL